MNVTIKDIAKLAQVSHTTVSRALNDSPLINRETKERIKAIAQQLNYTPNFNAKSLVLDRSYNIGLFFSTLQTGTSAVFFYESVRGVSSVIRDRYNLIVRGIDDYTDYSPIARRSFDGIIVMSQSEEDDRFIRHLLERGIPHVVLNRHVDTMRVMNILADDQMGAYGVVEHLVRSGHRSIAIIEGKKGFKSTQERKDGYLKALQAHGLPADGEYQVQGDYNVLSGYDAMKKLLQLERLPSAVFCSNDDMAVGAMKAISEAGLRVPDDISVVGYDDNGFSRYLSPSLTTVKRPLELIGRKGAEKLLGLIETKLSEAGSGAGTSSEPEKETLYVETELMVRESVRAFSA